MREKEWKYSKEKINDGKMWKITNKKSKIEKNLAQSIRSWEPRKQATPMGTSQKTKFGLQPYHFRVR